MILTEFSGLWFFYHCVGAFEFLMQNYWLWPVIDFWFLGNERNGSVLNFFWQGVFHVR